MKKINCIMLVDDNPADNEYHSIVISTAGVCDQIKIAYDGVEAISYLIKAGDQNQGEDFPRPDIIYLDINMPRMNGFEFLNEYSKLDENLKSKVMIIMLTTSLNPDDHTRALTYKEVAEFENKPLSVSMVKQVVEKYF